jgi:hypothetical protein
MSGGLTTSIFRVEGRGIGMDLKDYTMLQMEKTAI